MRKSLSTSEFADAIGLSESSARRLADSGDVRIHKTKGGHRKIPVEEAIRYVRDNGLKLVRPEILGLPPGLTETSSSETSSPELDEQGFYQALSRGESDHAIAALQALYLNGKSIGQICDGPIREALSKIGNRFPADKRSIYVEHRAVIICMRALLQLRSLMPSVSSAAQSAISAAPSGDPYLIPSLMTSLVLHESGYYESNLGPDTPVDILRDAIEEEQPKLICLSVTSPIRSRSQQLEIEQLKSTAESHSCELIVGGQSASQLEISDLKVCGSMLELQEFARSILKPERN